MSALNIAFIDFPFTILLTIANNTSNIGNPNTITGNTITANVYVLAIPKIDTIANINPKKFEPVSPINVFAGEKLYGKNPTNAPANAVINTIDISYDSFSTNIISTAGPPNLGIAFLCILLSSFGTSTAPILLAIFMVYGVATNDTINANKKAIAIFPHI